MILSYDKKLALTEQKQRLAIYLLRYTMLCNIIVIHIRYSVNKDIQL